MDRERVQAVALHLFAERGYDATSVDDIAAAAGLSRSTFFRLYGSKEAVVFFDHDALLARVEERLHNSGAEGTLATVTDAVKLVLMRFIGEGARARARYGLTSTVTALKERELVSGARYQSLFRRYLSSWGDGSPASELRAELMAAAVVAAHNHVLRRWLRGETEDPHTEIEAALAEVHRIHAVSDAEVPAVVVVPSGTSMRQVEAAVRRLVGSSDTAT
jgi:AcrR family transcriptional regulator